ncbi:hypothetical protein [Curtobacterium ammoniigenes]|uniref:hypothetical protein n=1 Tax=Curtobacterium ammoniigenes TaxID=395387 RepID=UPI0012EE916E|nr:hypothetical protein [Curtobacterium ammoniigenes]
MSSFRHPVGPERPSVYWRRRALFGAAAVLVIVVVLLIVFGRGGASASPEAAASASAAAHRQGAGSGAKASGGGAASGASTATTATAAPGSNPSASAAAAPPSASSAPSAVASAAASAAPAAACATGQIVLKPIVNAASFGPTEEPKIAMSITNSGSAACHIDLGSAQQVLTITSGSETYWSSKDCQTGGTHQDVTMQAGQTLTTPSITWDRTRSSTSTCNSSRPAVTAGGASYHLQVAVGSIQSASSAQFVLN